MLSRNFEPHFICVAFELELGPCNMRAYFQCCHSSSPCTLCLRTKQLGIVNIRFGSLENYTCDTAVYEQIPLIPQRQATSKGHIQSVLIRLPDLDLQ